jgi:hypothetical protein
MSRVSAPPLVAGADHLAAGEPGVEPVELQRVGARVALDDVLVEEEAGLLHLGGDRVGAGDVALLVDDLAVGADLAAEDRQRLDLRVHDADVVRVAVVQPAEGDPAERLLPVVGVGEAVHRDEVESRRKTLSLVMVLDDAARIGWRLVLEVEQ